ncbi:MAG: VOC family protein [Clostridium sp.]|nr:MULTISPECIES: VOC family protein [Clostridium]MBS6887593.1 VOC family protein [Clostridium sp.]MBS7132587.1 VOC family protein [Clostridium sp.]MDB2104785.1 VOC family protein [Clostridium paraputrificum]MDU1126676.1 VOC family protein [Clostridium sp.]MDU2285389.1 VOC family protein [Clostridium sp.]
MNLKEFCTGVQHIGIPTENIEQTILFYEGLGFDKLYDTYKKNGEQKVVFLQLGNLIIETYEEENISKNDGIINHIAIDCSKIYEVYNILITMGYKLLTDGIQSLDFWENGIQYFIIEGPNKEKLEFCQKL